VHLANVFKDLEDDRASGIYGLPQKLGIKRSRFGCAISFGGGGLLLALNTAEQSAWLIVLASIIFLIPLPRKYIFPFAMALGLAVMAVFVAAIG
jgi:1,4-dihydroxy-2-naphthoate octaprenyltransferase